MANGLIDQNTAVDPAAAAPPGDPGLPPEEAPLPEEALPPEPGGEVEPTPEEQEAVDRMVTAAQTVLYDKETSEPIMAILKEKAENPSSAVVEVATMLLGQLDAQSGGKLPAELILPVADQVMELIGEMGNEAGLFEYGEREHSLALQEAIQVVAENYGMDEEDMAGFMNSASPEEQEMARSQQDGYAQTAAPAAGQPAPAAAPPPVA